MKLPETQKKVHEKMLEWRAVDSLVASDKFEDAFSRAREGHLDHLTVILRSGQLEGLKQWIKERLAGPLKFQSYRQLRELGKRANIPRWSRLTRDELLEILEAKSA
jgi:hypothetical protein